MIPFNIEPDRILFKGTNFIIYKIWDLLPRHRNFPRGAFDVVKPWNGKPAVQSGFRRKKDRIVNLLYCHQTGGSVTNKGFDAPLSTAHFQVRDPSWVMKKVNGLMKWTWTGRGRGWPGIAYTWYIPWDPIIYNGKIVIFQCNELDFITWHSSDNEHSVSIVSQGYFRSRYMKKFRPRHGQTGKPNDSQCVALEGFIAEYAIPILGIMPKEIKGHCDSPKPKLMCPGDDIEVIYKSFSRRMIDRFVDTPLFPYLPGMLNLDNWRDRQASLILIGGHDIGDTGPKGNGVDNDPGDLTRFAIEVQEEQWGLPVDGYWDDTFDYFMKTMLVAHGMSQKDLDELK